MTAKKLRGFTLIELIVVIAIIGVLAAILIPAMIGYVRTSRIRKFNSNAAAAYRMAHTACVDMMQAGTIAPSSTVFTNNTSGSCVCTDGQGNTMDISDYAGSDFSGYVAFVTNPDGSGCSYAIWSERSLAGVNIAQLTDDEVKQTFISSNDIPRGCHPLKSPLDTDDDDN